MAIKAKVLSTRLDNLTGHDRLVIKAEITIQVLLNVFEPDVMNIHKSLDQGMEIFFDAQPRSGKIDLEKGRRNMFVEPNSIKLS